MPRSRQRCWRSAPPAARPPIGAVRDAADGGRGWIGRWPLSSLEVAGSCVGLQDRDLGLEGGAHSAVGRELVQIRRLARVGDEVVELPLSEVVDQLEAGVAKSVLALARAV